MFESFREMQQYYQDGIAAKMKELEKWRAEYKDLKQTILSTYQKMVARRQKKIPSTKNRRCTVVSRYFLIVLIA